MLGFVVVITGFACFWLSMCAIGGDGGQGGGSRASYALVDLVDIGIMVGAILLIAKLNRKPAELGTSGTGLALSLIRLLLFSFLFSSCAIGVGGIAWR